MAEQAVGAQRLREEVPEAIHGEDRVRQGLRDPAVQERAEEPVEHRSGERRSAAEWRWRRGAADGRAPGRAAGCGAAGWRTAGQRPAGRRAAGWRSAAGWRTTAE